MAKAKPKKRLVERFGDFRFARLVRAEVAQEIAERKNVGFFEARKIAAEMDNDEIADAAEYVLAERMATGDFTDPPEKLVAGGVFDSILDFIKNLDPEFKKALRDFILKLLGMIA